MRAGIFALLCLVTGLAAAAAPLDPDIGFFNATLGDFQAELADARAQHKQGVLLIFEREGCPYCRRLRDIVLSKPEVQAYYRAHFLVFPVDFDGDVDVTDSRPDTPRAAIRAGRQYGERDADLPVL